MIAQVEFFRVVNIGLVHFGTVIDSYWVYRVECTTLLSEIKISATFPEYVNFNTAGL